MDKDLIVGDKNITHDKSAKWKLSTSLYLIFKHLKKKRLIKITIVVFSNLKRSKDKILLK